MEKTVFSDEYKEMLELLREQRAAASVTQVELAESLEITQSAYSKLERGELRVDLIQLRHICKAIDSNVVAFVEQLEARLEKKKFKRRPQQRKRSR